jgi:hypothetical protein
MHLLREYPLLPFRPALLVATYPTPASTSTLHTRRRSPLLFSTLLLSPVCCSYPSVHVHSPAMRGPAISFPSWTDPIDDERIGVLPPSLSKRGRHSDSSSEPILACPALRCILSIYIPHGSRHQSYFMLPGEPFAATREAVLVLRSSTGMQNSEVEVEVPLHWFMAVRHNLPACQERTVSTICMYPTLCFLRRLLRRWVS